MERSFAHHELALSGQLDAASVPEAELDLQDAAERTLLMCAVSRGHYSMVLDLVLRGADVSIPDNSGCTPLHFAAIYGFTTIVNLLLSAGAWTDLAAESNSLHRPIDLADDAANPILARAFDEHRAELSNTGE